MDAFDLDLYGRPTVAAPHNARQCFEKGAAAEGRPYKQDDYFA